MKKERHRATIRKTAASICRNVAQTRADTMYDGGDIVTKNNNSFETQFVAIKNDERTQKNNKITLSSNVKNCDFALNQDGS